MARKRKLSPDDQARQYVGRTGLYPVRSRYADKQSGTPELAFPVKVADAKAAYGNILLRIEPVGGEGHWWVRAKNVRFRSAS